MCYREGELVDLGEMVVKLGPRDWEVEEGQEELLGPVSRQRLVRVVMGLWGQMGLRVVPMCKVPMGMAPGELEPQVLPSLEEIR